MNSPSNLIYKLTSAINLTETIIDGQVVWVIYGKKIHKKSNDIELPARLKSALRPYDQYVVPLRLKNKFNHETYTKKVNDVLGQIKTIADQIDYNKPKTVNRLKQYSPILVRAVRYYKKYNILHKKGLISAVVEYIDSKELKHKKKS